MDARFGADYILRTALSTADDIDPVQGDPGKLTAAQVEAFLTHNWTQLAAKAYWGFSQTGRGCLFVFVRGALPAKVDRSKLNGVYMPLLHFVDLLDGSDLVTFDTALEIGSYVAEYDPDREAVICIANPGWEQWAVFRAHHPLVTAKRAFAQAGRQFGTEIG